MDDSKVKDKGSTKVQVRVSEDIREYVRDVLKKLGLNESQVVNMLYHQIKIHGAVPFDLTLPKDYLPIEELNDEVIEEVGDSLKDIAKGKYIEIDPNKDVISQLDDRAKQLDKKNT